MKIVIAIDSLKGSLTSIEAGNAAKDGILRAFHEQEKKPEIIIKPLADGGEGTTEALIEGLGGELISVEVEGPLGCKVEAHYGILPDKKTAVIEMAEAAGITLVKREDLNPHRASTYGVGEMIGDAMRRGCRDFIVGIGGSATTDGGAGMLQALGVDLLAKGGQQIGRGVEELDLIASISLEHMNPLVKECSFQIACDVKNPLCGTSGAVHVYGPQKGVKDHEKEKIDAKLRHLAEKTAELFGVDKQNEAGTGAAGGLGFAFVSYFPNVTLQSGIAIVLNAIALEEDVKDADIVITGEGQLDAQTAMGKVPVGVAGLAKKYGCKVVAFAGGVTKDAVACNKEGIDAFFPIVRGVTSLEEAMEKENAKENMALSVEQVMRLIIHF